MRTPPLRRRITGIGVLVLAVLLVLVFVVAYVLVRTDLERSLDEVLTVRAGLAADLATEHDDPERLAAQLTAIGVPAVVRTPDGEVHSAEPLSPRFGAAPPAPATITDPAASRTVELADGTTVEVFASRAGVDRALRTLLLIALASIAGATLAAYLLLRHLVEDALEPLAEMATTSERIAAGERDQRLDPDRPATELGRTASAFDGMVDALEAAVHEAEDERERSRRFLADAAHQLRTPIAGVRGAVELLLQEHDPDVRDRLFTHAVRESARAGRLVSDLLLIARLDQGRPARPVPTDLEELIRDEVARVAELAPQLSVLVHLHHVPDDPVLLDPDEVREALGNLLDNARRHAVGTVEIDVDATTDEVVIRVRDDGPGVPEGAEELIFERFASLDGHSGSGLGLAIARGLAESHGGTLRYENGAFVLRLPLEVASERGDVRTDA